MHLHARAEGGNIADPNLGGIALLNQFSSPLRE
jgi:hypothetical protein